MLWESAGEGEYSVADIEKKSRGTDVILHLREDEKEFLNEWRLREIISKYSDHIGLPVEMLTKEYDDEGKECGEKMGEKLINPMHFGRVLKMMFPMRNTKSFINI